MPLNDAEQNDLREALHGMNNALNSISMQAELARLYVESNDVKRIEEALDIIMAQCRKCSAMTRGAHEQLLGATVTPR